MAKMTKQNPPDLNQRVSVTAPPAPGAASSTDPKAAAVAVLDAPAPAAPKAVKATALSMFRVPDGWTLIKLDLAMTPNGPEILSWETMSDEGPLPKTHVDNMFRVAAATTFLYPQD